MSDKSAIEWTDATWPIVQGCDPVSEGCVHCYAVPLLWRMMHHPDPKISGPLQGLVEKYVNAAGEEILRFTGKLALREDRLDWPLQWKKPRKIFVPSHGDLFHKNVPDAFIDKVFARMALCPQHTFQVLTKRAERMRDYCSRADAGRRTWNGADWVACQQQLPESHPSADYLVAGRDRAPWPLPNIWLGVSAERQQEADERIPLLLQTPAAVRFVSAEPLLGPIDLMMLKSGDKVYDAVQGCIGTHIGDGEYDGARPCAKLDWIIVGGESSKKARPMHPDWARSLREQCKAAGVKFFFKQWGEFAPLDVFSDAKADKHVYRVGKKGAGALLDGREWREFPLP